VSPGRAGPVLRPFAVLLAAALLASCTSGGATAPSGPGTPATEPPVVTVPPTEPAPPPAFPPQAPPNVVVIVFDDLGIGDLPAYGGTLAPTPNIDALAAGGTRFTNAYSNGSVCSPTRAALLTGLHPSEFGFRRSVLGVSSRGLPAGIATLPGVLSEHGYATGHFGKWHLGWTHADQRPLAMGYDEAILVTIPADYRAPVFLDNGVDRVVTGGHLTEATVGLALDFVERNAADPFFVSIWLNAPHVPLRPPDEWAEQFSDVASGRYAALIADADEEIGRLLDTLDDLAVADDTIVVLLSDNGADFPYWGSTAGYRGEKTTVFEGGIRVPLIVRWPGVAEAGSVSEDMVLTWDLFPTVAAAAGIDLSGIDLDGRSIVPALRGDGLPPIETPLVWESRFSEYAVRFGDWKLVDDQTWPRTDPLLFDLSVDPYETQDLAAAKPDVVGELLAVYQAFRLSTGRIPTRYDGGTIPAPGDGIVQVADGRFDVHDGDFTFRIAADVVPPARGVSVIAAKWGTWSLEYTSGGAVTLAITDDDGVVRDLRSDSLPLGPHTIAFTVAGTRFSGSTVSLFVDDERVASRSDLAFVAAGRSRITLGSDPSGGRAVDGTLSDPAIYVRALNAADLAELTAHA